VDIDPEAIQVALDNMHNNGIYDDIEISTTMLNRLEDGYSVVLANILAEDLIRMAPELTARILPGGVIVLSGILVEREQGVLDAYLACGLEHAETTRQLEWSCIVLLRRS
jgi:ribosomal protein L11 methyltransferase